MQDSASTDKDSMDYLIEAKKFIQRSCDASTPEVISQNVSMAEWVPLAEREGRSTKDPKKKPH
jgi:hypothetical protein